MKNIVYITLLLLCSCAAREEHHPVKIEKAEYVIVDFDPPKHVYIDLRRVSDNRTFNHVYISKHCNNWRKNVKIGDTISLNRYTFTDGSRDIVKFSSEELRKCFCK